MSIVRVDGAHVDVLVLGDSPVIVGHIGQEPEVLVDDRLTRLPNPHRATWRRRLSDRHGYDEQHRAILRKMQAVQSSRRNRAMGATSSQRPTPLPPTKRSPVATPGVTLTGPFSPPTAPQTSYSTSGSTTGPRSPPNPRRHFGCSAAPRLGRRTPTRTAASSPGPSATTTRP